MSWSIPQALRMFKDHTLLFRARVGRKSAGRSPPSSSIEIFTETSISYQCHGVFPRPYGCLRTIPYYFELGSAERALAAHALEFHQTLFAAYRLSTASWRFFEIQRLLAIAYTQVFQV